jgi:hypothetical protein
VKKGSGDGAEVMRCGEEENNNKESADWKQQQRSADQLTARKERKNRGSSPKFAL